MPMMKLLGSSLAPGSVGPRQVVAVPATKTLQPPIQGARYARNGKHPDVACINAMLEGCNQAALWNTRELFRGVGRIAAAGVIASFGAGDRARWRFACHTGPYTHALVGIGCMVPQSAGSAENARARLDIANGAGTVIATSEFVHGLNPGGTGSVSTGWRYLKPVIKYFDVDPDTDYFGTFYDVDWGRLQSATVFELPSMTENFSGYLPQNLTAQSHILDVYREKMVTLLYNLWRRAGATVLTWSVDDGTAPATIAVNTPTNLIDLTSTVLGAATPGFTLDMTGKNRVSQPTGVPVKMWVYCKTTSATNKGRIYLKSSGGSAVLQITDGIANPGPTWLTATGVLPATVDKYDLMFDNNGSGTLSVYAVSIAEYE